jgi:hypothetical protein
MIRTSDERAATMVSAWEFGTGAAVAGWLMDAQTHRLVRELRRSHSSGPTSRPEPPHPAELLGGWPIDPLARPLQPHDRLERSRLGVTIEQRLQARGELVLEAALANGAVEHFCSELDSAAMTFTVLVTALTPERPVWVTFEERPGGFSTARLLPVFDGAGPAGRAYCFVDDALTAINVVEWGLSRFSLALSDFQRSGGS